MSIFSNSDPVDRKGTFARIESVKINSTVAGFLGTAAVMLCVGVAAFFIMERVSASQGKGVPAESKLMQFDHLCGDYPLGTEPRMFGDRSPVIKNLEPCHVPFL